MIPTHGASRALALVAAAAIGAAGCAFPRAAAADAATLTAAPATGVVDGQYVKLSFSGFAPGIGLAFRQCTASPHSVDSDCTAPNQQVFGITDSKGAGNTYIPVYSGNDTGALNAAGTAQVPCDAAHTCVIAAFRSATDLSTAVFAPIEFGPSPDSCPAPGPNAILGAGSASAYRAIFAWESAVCQPPTSISAGYTFSSSPAGVSNFQKGLTDFGVTGPSPEAPPAGGPTFKYAPLTVSAVGVAYRMYDRRGPQITTLTLTPDLLAKLFLGQISNWNVEPDILALNPNIQFPPRVVAFARGESSAQSYVFTSWLARNSPSVWTAGAQQIFPQGNGQVVGVTGSAGVGRAVVDPTTDFFGQGNVGFMDTSTAAFYGLPTIQIKRPDGSAVAATSDSIKQAITHATVNGDGTVTPDYGTTDPLAYPMPLVTYMLAPTNTIAPASGATLARFLRYAVQGGQSNLPSGYSQLPPNLVSESMQAASAIPVPSPPGAAAVPASPAPTPSLAPAPPSSPAAADTAPAALTPSGSLPAAPTPDASAVPATPHLLPGALAAGPSALPAPSASLCAPPTHCPAAHPPVKGGPRPGTLPLNGAAIGLLDQLADATPARFILPAITGVGVVALAIGLTLQAVARRRSWLPARTVGGRAYALKPSLLADGHE